MAERLYDGSGRGVIMTKLAEEEQHLHCVLTSNGRDHGNRF